VLAGERYALGLSRKQRRSNTNVSYFRPESLLTRSVAHIGHLELTVLTGRAMMQPRMTRVNPSEESIQIGPIESGSSSRATIQRERVRV